MKKTLILTLLLLVACNFSAFAQEEEEYEKDILEITFFGGLGSPSNDLKEWHDTLGAGSGIGYGLDIGYFATYNLVAGFSFSYTSFDIDSPDRPELDNLTHRLYSPSLYLKYYLSTEGNFVPYGKGSIGLDFAKFTTSVDNVAGSRYRQLSYDPALSYSFGLGAFYYTHDYAGFFIEGNYRTANTKEVEYNYAGDIGTFGTKLSYLDIHAGIRILIGSNE